MPRLDCVISSAQCELRLAIRLNIVRRMDDLTKLRNELTWRPLTYELRRRGEPLREWFEKRFPYKNRIFEDVRQAAGQHITVQPFHQNSQTVGWAYELMLRFMFDPVARTPDEAYLGIDVEVLRTAGRRHRGDELQRIWHEWKRMVDSAADLARQQLDFRNADGMKSGVEPALEACWVLALLVEFSRHASLEQSVLLPLLERPRLHAASKLAPRPVIDDLCRLYHLSFKHIQPLVCRGLVFAPDLASPIEAQPDMLLGNSVVEIKCCAGRRRSPDGPYSYGLGSAALFQMIAYGLLANGSHGADGIALFNPRWDLMLEWSFSEICDRAGLPGSDVHRLRDDLRDFLLAGKPPDGETALLHWQYPLKYDFSEAIVMSKAALTPVVKCECGPEIESYHEESTYMGAVEIWRHDPCGSVTDILYRCPQGCQRPHEGPMRRRCPACHMLVCRGCARAPLPENGAAAFVGYGGFCESCCGDM
jgi:hypothetical protein